MGGVLRRGGLLQITWFVMATIFNLCSYRIVTLGGTGWAGPTPLIAQFVACVLFLVVMLGVFRKTAFIVAAPAAIIVLALGGVLRHVAADTALYASLGTRMTAIAINSFGVVAFIIGLSDALKRRKRRP